MGFRTDDYLCGGCGETHEYTYRVGESPDECSACGVSGKLKRQVSAPNSRTRDKTIRIIVRDNPD